MGRPRKIGGALNKTPPSALPESDYQQTGMEELEVPVLTLEPETVPALDPPVESVPVLEPPVEVNHVLDPPVELVPVLEPPMESVPVLEPLVESVPVLEPQVESVPVLEPPVPTGKKCRAIYGVQNKHLWCAKCKAKKKCIANTVPMAPPSISGPPLPSPSSPPPMKKARVTRARGNMK